MLCEKLKSTPLLGGSAVGIPNIGGCDIDEIQESIDVGGGAPLTKGRVGGGTPLRGDRG